MAAPPNQDDIEVPEKIGSPTLQELYAANDPNFPAEYQRATKESASHKDGIQ